MDFTTRNPATGQDLKTYPALSDSELERRIASAGKAQERWSRTPVKERAALLDHAAKALETHKDELAQLMCREMGKLLGEGRAEVDKCAWLCRYYAEHAPQMLQPQSINTEAARSYVRFDPLGLVLAIMPWNYPLWQVFRCAVPTLAAGNAMLLKHAPNVLGCADAIETLFEAAGFPKDLLSNLVIDIDQVEQVIRHPSVQGVTLTGSVHAGRAVAALAGRHLKKSVMELGGSDPYIILEDADLDLAAEKTVFIRMLNAGQTCIASKRFIAVASVYDAFLEKVSDRMRRYRPGPPEQPSSSLAPLAREDIRITLHDQVERAVEAGARLVLGGTVPAGPGYFYPPTLLAETVPGMSVFDEETFGPVAAAAKAQNREHALELANRSIFGLGAAVFTRDIKKAEAMAAQLQCGSVFINDFVKSDPRLPFGGIKASGYGRELGNFGILEFTNIKTVYTAG